MKDTATYQVLADFLAKERPELYIKPCKPKDVVFDERTKLMCYQCARYNVSWRCPPRIPNLPYQELFQKFENAAFVWVDMPMTKETYADVRNESSVALHYGLLELEKILLSRNIPIYWSFIAGSCKLCKSGCGKEKCNNPYLARIPLEALGVNVVETAAKYDIPITFPATDHMMRVGMILW